MNASHSPNLHQASRIRRMHEEAAEWLLLRESPNWSSTDQEALEAWLAASPEHPTIWQRMQQTQAVLPHIRQASDPAWRPASHPILTQAAAQTTAPNPAPGASNGRCHAQPQTAPRKGWHWGWGPSLALTSIALTLLCGGGFYWWDHTPTYRLQAQTALGQTRTLELPDGSRIDLNVDTSVQVRYYHRRRETTLAHGEAFFQVASNAQQPFTVEHGRSQIQVVGTAFNVKAAPERLQVQVSQGVVQVLTDACDQQAPVVRLRAGTGLALNAATLQYQPLQTPPADVGQWRSGQISFRRTPLGDVASELSQYLGQPITLASPALATKSISGIVSTTHPQAFLHALPDLLPLRVQQQTDGSWRISEQ